MATTTYHFITDTINGTWTCNYQGDKTDSDCPIGREQEASDSKIKVYDASLPLE